MRRHCRRGSLIDYCQLQIIYMLYIRKWWRICWLPVFFFFFNFSRETWFHQGDALALDLIYCSGSSVASWSVICPPPPKSGIPCAVCSPLSDHVSLVSFFCNFILLSSSPIPLVVVLARNYANRQITCSAHFVELFWSDLFLFFNFFKKLTNGNNRHVTSAKEGPGTGRDSGGKGDRRVNKSVSRRPRTRPKWHPDKLHTELLNNQPVLVTSHGEEEKTLLFHLFIHVIASSSVLTAEQIKMR